MSDYKPKGPLHLFVDDLIRDTIGWSDDARFKYVKLLNHMWTQGGFIPNSDEYIAEVIGLYRGRGWRKVVTLLRSKLITKALLTDKKGPFLSVSNELLTDKETDFLTQPRLFAEMVKAFEISRIKANAGKLGGEKRVANAKAALNPPHATSHRPLNTLSKDKGADAPSGISKEDAQNNETIDAALYRRGKEVLGPKAGGIITKLRKRDGDEKALKAIEWATTMTDPVAWIVRHIEGEGPPDENKPDWFNPKYHEMRDGVAWSIRNNVKARPPY